VAGNDTAEAVPFGLILPPSPVWQFNLRAGLHGENLFAPHATIQRELPASVPRHAAALSRAFLAAGRDRVGQRGVGSPAVAGILHPKGCVSVSARNHRWSSGWPDDIRAVPARTSKAL